MIIGTKLKLTSVFFNDEESWLLHETFPELSQEHTYEVLAVRQDLDDTGATALRCIETGAVFNIEDEPNLRAEYWCIITDQYDFEYEIQ